MSMNPKAYCAEHGISTGEFVKRMQAAGAPKYSKITHCMASNRDYGVTLRTDVARNAGVSPRRPNRKNANGIYFRLNDADYAAFLRAMEKNGHGTTQEAGAYAAKRYIQEAKTK